YFIYIIYYHRLRINSLFFVFFLMIRLPPISTLFPYTTLFRSVEELSLLLLGDLADVGLGNAPLRRDMFAGGVAQLHSQVFRRIRDRKSTRLNSSHVAISYAVFCLKKKKDLHYYSSSFITPYAV